MAEAGDHSDPCLFTKRAKRGTGSSAVDGVVMITRSKVQWQPNDPSKAQPSVIELGAITSEHPQSLGELPAGRWQRQMPSQPQLLPF